MQYGSKEYYKIIEELKQIHSDKNHDYADNSDPLSNFKECEKFGIPAWKGCLVRMSDKWCRIVQLTKKEAKNESIEDSLKDLANYAVLCLVLYKGRK